MKRNLFFMIILLTAAAVHSQNNFSQSGMATQEMKDGGLVAGHSSLPINSKVLVTNLNNGKEIEVTIIRHLSPSASRIIDLSPAAAQALSLGSGGRVNITTIQQPRPPELNSPPPPQENPSIIIVNYTGNNIKVITLNYVYSGREKDSMSVLSNGIKNGESYTIGLPESLSKVNRYNIIVEDVNRRKYTKDNVSVSANARFEFGSSPPQEKPTITIVNNTGEPINAVSIRYAGSDWVRYSWSNSTNIDSGSSFPLTLPNPLNAVNRYDIRLERPNSLGTYTKNTIAVSSGERIEFTSSDRDGGSNVAANIPQQYDPESDFRVARLSEGISVEITGYAGTKQAVRIPPMIQGLPVTRIGVDAFANKNITSVTIPNGVKQIEFRAFYKCTSLTSVTMPNSLVYIGSAAFSFCDKLVSVTIPASVYIIGNSAFDFCTSLTSLTIPNNIEFIFIGEAAFRFCTSLTSVTIPAGVYHIGELAFKFCDSLISVTLQGTIAKTKFGSVYDEDNDEYYEGRSPFDGDLKTKYLTGGIGTYTRQNGGNTWTKR